jgi:hypothetical protein
MEEYIKTEKEKFLRLLQCMKYSYTDNIESNCYLIKGILKSLPQKQHNKIDNEAITTLLVLLKEIIFRFEYWIKEENKNILKKLINDYDGIKFLLEKIYIYFELYHKQLIAFILGCIYNIINEETSLPPEMTIIFFILNNTINNNSINPYISEIDIESLYCRLTEKSSNNVNCIIDCGIIPIIKLLLNEKNYSFENRNIFLFGLLINICKYTPVEKTSEIKSLIEFIKLILEEKSPNPNFSISLIIKYMKEDIERSSDNKIEFINFLINNEIIS